MSKVLEHTAAERRAGNSLKTPTRFVANLLKQQAISPQEADLLNQLPNPHLQFEALKRYRAAPQDGLASHVHQVKSSYTAESGTTDPSIGTENSVRGLFKWSWQVLRQHGMSRRTRWMLSGASVLAVLVFVGFQSASWLAERWSHRRSVSEAPAIMSAESAPTPAAAPAATASPANAPVAEAPAKKPAGESVRPASGPQNFAAHPTANQMVQLTWDSLASNTNYHLYSGSGAQMQDAQLEEEAAIPVNWYNWMPPGDGSSVWLAVKGILPNGKETQFSNAIRVDATPALGANVAPATTPVAPSAPKQ